MLMLFSMDIRDPVHGNIPLSNSEAFVVNSAVFQRLRSIKQLGFAEFSFPGATHNRFLHSIGVCHLAGIAFDSIFKGYPFKKQESRWRLRQALRLAALLHDIGHGPLSHTSEEVMPAVHKLNVKAYDSRKGGKGYDNSTRANHEDYTIKMITDSPLTETISKHFPDLTPLHVACLVDKSLICKDDFFTDGELNFRPILSQLVSSEMDVDRMDYLGRDAYFCGINYGKAEVEWLLANLRVHIENGDVNLALNRRALYTFDDFLISRHHMHLMVYFHHKSIIFEEMLHRYLTSPSCDYHLPADINEYLKCTDFSIYEHMSRSSNDWAQRISRREPYRVLFEHHSTQENPRLENMKKVLEANGMKVILSNSKTRLSKYHSSYTDDTSAKIFVVDQYDRQQKPEPIVNMTEIFQKYEETRAIERVYVPPEQFVEAERILIDKKL